jgi:hypothetical protein
MSDEQRIAQLDSNLQETINTVLAMKKKIGRYKAFALVGCTVAGVALVLALVACVLTFRSDAASDDDGSVKGILARVEALETRFTVEGGTADQPKRAAVDHAESVSGLEARVKDLERQSGTSSLPSNRVFPQIQAKQIEILNDQDVPVVTLTAGKSGGSIEIATNKEKTILDMSATEDGNGSISLFSAKGKPSFTASSTGNGEGEISTYNAAGRKVFNVTSNKIGSANIATYNADGIKLFEAGTAPKGGGGITTYNDEGTMLVAVGSNQGRAGGIATYSDGGKMLFGVGLNKIGGGTISTYSDEGKMLFGVSSTEGGYGGIATYNAAGNPLFAVVSTKDINGALLRLYDGKGRKPQRYGPAARDGGSVFSKTSGEKVVPAATNVDGRR